MPSGPLSSKRSRGEELGMTGSSAYNRMAADPMGMAANVAEASTAPQPISVSSVEGEEAEMAIVGMILMPEEFSTVLYADPFSTEKMCKKGILQRQQASWTNQPPASARWLKPEEFFIASFRGIGSIWRRMLVYDPNSLRADRRFRLKHTTTRAVTSGDFLKLQDGGGPFFDFNIADCTDGAGGSAYSTQCNTTTMVCGRSKDTMNDARWFLTNATQDPDAGFETTLTITPQSAIVNNCIISAIGWRGGEPVEVDTVVFAVGATAAQTIQLTGDNGQPDYMTFRYFCDDANDGNFAGLKGFRFDYVDFCAGLCQVPVDTAYANITQLGKMTTIAASVRLTEIAAPLNVEGNSTVACTRDPATWYRQYLVGGSGTGSVFTVVNNYRDAYQGPLLEGGYGYHMPFRKTQFEMDDCMEIDYQNNIIKDLWWSIEDDSDVNVFSARTINNGENNGLTGMGADAWITCVTHFNWLTDNKWPDADYSRLKYNVWMNALDHLRQCPRVMSNKHHMGTLLRWLVDKGRLAKRFVGPVLKVGGPILARHFLGGEVTDQGVKLLQDAYQVGNSIARQLKGGGM